MFGGKLEETVEETPFSRYGWLFCPLATWPCVPEEPFPKGRSPKMQHRAKYPAGWAGTASQFPEQAGQGQHA